MHHIFMLIDVIHNFSIAYLDEMRQMRAKTRREHGGCISNLRRKKFL